MKRFFAGLKSECTAVHWLPTNQSLDSGGNIELVQEQYFGVLAAIGLAALVSGVFVTGTYFLGPKKHTIYKDAPYECGVTPVGDAKERFPIKFYLVAMLFILFDIEVVFLWSWMTVFRNSDTPFMVFSFFEFLAYMVTWLVGYVYAIKIGATDWDETTSLAPEKLVDSPKPAFVEPAPLAEVA